jgi:hypothetical protein
MICPIPKSIAVIINKTFPCIIPLDRNIIVGIIASDIAFLIVDFLKYKNHTKQYSTASTPVKTIYTILHGIPEN